MPRTVTAILLAGTALAGLVLAPRHVAAQQAATAEALAIIVHRSNPVDELSSAQLKRIYMFDTQNWPHGRKITVMVREKDQPDRAEAIRLICGISEAEYERHVLLQTFRGSLGSGPRSIQSVSAMLRFVFNAPGAMGTSRLTRSTALSKSCGSMDDCPPNPHIPCDGAPGSEGTTDRWLSRSRSGIGNGSYWR